VRFLHVADLHLGKQMNDLSLLQDQEYVLQQVVHIAAEEKVDEDEGDGNAYKDGNFVTTEFNLDWSDKAVFTINPAKGNTDLIPIHLLLLQIVCANTSKNLKALLSTWN